MVTYSEYNCLSYHRPCYENTHTLTTVFCITTLIRQSLWTKNVLYYRLRPSFGTKTFFPNHKTPKTQLIFIFLKGILGTFFVLYVLWQRVIKTVHITTTSTISSCIRKVNSRTYYFHTHIFN